MSEGWNIAVLGATGAVGEALLETLAERQFPVGEIYALARNESAGEQLRFGGKTITVQDAAEFDWTQAQLAFFVAGKEATAAWVEEATNSGCLVIDSSGLFALEPDVPLLVPGFPLINAVADMFKGHINTGLARWAIASLLTLATCVGVVMALTIWGLRGWV